MGAESPFSAIGSATPSYADSKGVLRFDCDSMESSARFKLGGMVALRSRRDLTAFTVVRLRPAIEPGRAQEVRAPCRNLYACIRYDA